MEEEKQIKFIDLVLKSIVAVVGVYILILILVKKTGIENHKLECCIMSGDSLLLMVSIMFSYYSIKRHGDSNKVSKYADFLYLLGMGTLLITGLAITVK